MKLRTVASIALAFDLAGSGALAGFHLIEVEQVVGGLNGDPNALAVQLRLRSGGQTQFGSTHVQIRAWNSAGTSSSVLATISANFGTGTSGSRILFTTSAFDTQMAGVPGFASNFTLAVVPFSYLAGGRITFETVSGSSVIWALAFGTYSGSNTGATYDDADGNFGAPFASGLPSDGRGILFKNGLSASSTNDVDYALTPGAATLTNNAGTAFTVVPEPGVMGTLALGGAALSGLAWARRRR